MALYILGLLAFLSSANSQTITNLALDSVANSATAAACGTYTYFKATVVNPCHDLIISVQSSKGQGDIYVQKSENIAVYPTRKMLTWGSTTTKNNVLTISHWEPAFSVGDYYIGVYSNCDVASSPLSFSIVAKTGAADDTDDIFKYPALALNKILRAQAHTYLRLCIPYDCITLTMNLTVQTAAVFPTLIMSRIQPKANIENDVYRASGAPLVTDPTDPSARDENGYLSGAYYIAAYGWCTPSAFCPNNSTCYPCEAYGRGVLFNVTVVTTQLDEGHCSTVNYVRKDPDTVNIVAGVTYTGSMKCNENRYFQIAVPDPCYNLNIFSTAPHSQPCCQSGDIYVGKWPTTHPFQQNLGWSNFFWGNKNLTLSAFDPTFSGGYSCGSDGKSLCLYYIQINSWCDPASTPANFILNYTLLATLERAHAIFGVPQTNQKLTSSGALKNYQFCVSEESSVVAQLNSIEDRCPASNKYDYYDMLISPKIANPSQNNLVWHLHGNNVSLTTDLPNFRTGQYYVSVIGNCEGTGLSTCHVNNCTCGSCTVLAASSYSLLVDWAGAVSMPALYTPTMAPTGATLLSVLNPKLDNGQIAGIVIGIFFENLVLIGIVICVMRLNFFSNKKKYIEMNGQPTGAVEGLSPLAGNLEEAPNRPYRSA